MKRLTIIIMLALAFNAGAQDMKIISFNIRYNSYNNIDGENGWPYRKAAVVKMIKEENPAAIGLQEALIDQLQYLDSCLSNYRRIGVGRDDGKVEGEFMAIYYDTLQLYPIGYKTVWLSETPFEPSLGWDAACRRTATVAHFEDLQTHKELYYVNTHLDHVGKTARAEGVKILASMFPYREGWTYKSMRVIVGGDMNSTIDDTIFNALYDIHLQPARDLTPNTSYVDTYNAYGKDKSSLIDHFFVREVKVKRFRTLNGDYGVPYISDHYPIEIVIRL